MRALFLTLLLCLSAHASDVTGKWTGSFSSGPVYMILKQDGAKLSGSGGPTEAQQVLKFNDGAIASDHLAFQAGEFQFDLTLSGDELKGEARKGDQSIPLTLHRVGAPLKPGAPLRSEFEVASVKRNLNATGSLAGRGGSIHSSRAEITMEGVSLWKAVAFAYGISEDKDYAITAPGWMRSERYDIAAKLPADVTYEEVQAMMQNLLTARFRMKTHQESKDMAMYALVTGKGGSKLHEAEPGRSRFSMGRGKIEGQAPLGAFADRLSQFVDRPVVDMTGLVGTFDISVTWSPESDEPREGASLFTALQEQLGLRLEARKGPVDVLVVDQAEKVPAEN
jgi:uncharacterized protein (TIGR03435 family)